jgi:hypothetical protein
LFGLKHTDKKALPSERADAFPVLRPFFSAAIIGENVRIVKVKSGKKEISSRNPVNQKRAVPLLCGANGTAREYRIRW